MYLLRYLLITILKLGVSELDQAVSGVAVYEALFNERLLPLVDSQGDHGSAEPLCSGEGRVA